MLSLLMYWNVWRKSYHEGRQIYHRSMQEFHEGQIKLMEEWSKMVLSLVDNAMKLYLVKYLDSIMPKPTAPMGMPFGFGSGFNPGSFLFGQEEKEKGK